MGSRTDRGKNHEYGKFNEVKYSEKIGKLFSKSTAELDKQQ